MDSWNLVHLEDREYSLLNSSRTVVRLSEHAVVDLGLLFSRMEEAGVPVSYSDGISEIYFTILRGDEPDRYYEGDINDGKIRISTDSFSRERVHLTLVHELAHHLDDRYEISERPKIREEKKVAAGSIDAYARRNVAEYVACGFEVFYFGTPAQRKKMRTKNPKLFNVIRYLHAKHRTVNK